MPRLNVYFDEDESKKLRLVSAELNMSKEECVKMMVRNYNNNMKGGKDNGIR